MGKNLKNADLVLRTGKVAFYLVPGNSAYTRMEGFTSLSTSKNPTEYERQYVDEDFKRTDITGYNTAISYALDRYKKHPVTDDIIDIHENELLGQDAVRSIISVDMTTAQQDGSGIWSALAKMRDYAVIPDADGDTTDCMTYSGNFKTRGEMEDVEVRSTDDFQTIYVVGAGVAPFLRTLKITDRIGTTTATLTPEFKNTTISYTANITGNITIAADAESSTYRTTVMHKGITNNFKGTAILNNVSDGDYIYITVDNGGTEQTSVRTYTILCKSTTASSD